MDSIQSMTGGMLIGLVAATATAFSTPEALDKQLTKRIETFQKRTDTVGLSVSIVHPNAPTWAKGFGWADEENEVPMTADTPMPVASVTKVFTAIAAKQLEARGQLQLDDPVQQYVPEFKLNPNPRSANAIDEQWFSLRRLLTHHAPIRSDFVQGYYHPWEGSDSAHAYVPNFLKQLSNDVVTQDEGQAYKYCNVCIELVSTTIARQSGLDYPDYIDQQLLTPLGMNNSAIGLYRQADLNASKGYLEGEESALKPLRGTGEGDLVTSANDMALFMRAVLEQSVPGLTADELRAMMAPQGVATQWDLGHRFGLGWHLAHAPGYPNVPMAYHDGGTEPFSARLALLPTLGIGVMLSANSDEVALDPLQTDVLQLLVEHHTGKKPNAKQDQNRSPKIDERFYGNYASQFGLIKIKPSWTGPRLQIFGLWLSITRRYENHYGAQIRLGGVLPIPNAEVKSFDLELRIVDDTPVIGLSSGGKFHGIAPQFQTPPVHPNWLAQVGDYQAVYPEADPFMQRFAISVDDETGLAYVHVKVGTISNSIALPVDLSHPTIGMTHGVGRHKGEAMKLLDDNRLWYSGVEMELKP